MKIDLMKQINQALTQQNLDYDSISRAISSLEILCDSKSKVKVFSQGQKICLECNNQDNNLLQSKQFQCLNCPQIYHERCYELLLEAQYDLFKQQIQQTENTDYLNQLDEFIINCQNCKTQKLPESLLDKIGLYKLDLEKLKNEQTLKIKENIHKKKLQSSKCQICKQSWILNQLEDQVYFVDVQNNDNFQKVIKINVDGVESNVNFFRTSSCGHIFCRECLQNEFIANYLSNNNFNLTCQADQCNQNLNYSEIKIILDSKITWFQKYKNYKFLVEPFSKIQDKVSFLRCKGVYQIELQQCGNVKINERQTVINCIKEIEEQRKQIKNDNVKQKLNLQNLNSIKKDNKYQLKCCKRVYQVNIVEDFNMANEFKRIMNGIEDKQEIQDRQTFQQQYLKSDIKEYQMRNEDNDVDQYLIQCQDDYCQLQFCINGCLDPHEQINVCPNINQNDQIGQDNNNNNIFKVDPEDVIKEIGKSSLYCKLEDDTMQFSSASIYCFMCFRELKIDPQIKVGVDGEVPYIPCQCNDEILKLREWSQKFKPQLDQILNNDILEIEIQQQQIHAPNEIQDNQQMLLVE